MYRATAEIVSGTRVFADGKWLQCIGNKCVSVGDRIWTDGRCVYGHEQESEQPKIITATPDDESIPILLFFDGKYHFYTYTSRLKELKRPNELSEVDEKMKDMGVTNEPNYTYTFGFESNEKSIYKFMINDYRREVFVSGSETQNVYATNIDKIGNKYVLKGTSSRLTISKNGENVPATNISGLIEQLKQETVDSIPSGSGRPDSRISSTYLIRGRFAVIENEKNWSALLFIYAASGQHIISDEYDVSYKRITSELFGGPSSTTISRTRHTSGAAGAISVSAYLVNQDGYSLVSRCSGTYYDLPEEYYDVHDLHNALIDYWTYSRTVYIPGDHHYSASITPPNHDVKIQLQDVFYFTVNDYPNFPTNMVCYPLFMNISIYTQKNKLILTETFPTNSNITIAKIGARKYLIGVRICATLGRQILDANDGYQESATIGFVNEEGYTSNNERYAAYADETPYIDAGLYLFDGKTLEKIAPGDCKNEHLRPMAKYNNWQNRVQKLK